MVLRLCLGIVFAALAFVLFYYVPANLAGLLSSALPPSSRAAGTAVVAALINPTLPPLGLAAAALVFLGVLLRGTKVYGTILVLNGLVFLAYVYLAFQGGTVTLSLPPGLPSAASGSISLSMGNLLLVFLIAPILTVVKGLVLTVVKPSAPQRPAA